jgi:hypothetical protein
LTPTLIFKDAPRPATSIAIVAAAGA